MNTDARLSIGFASHPKTKKLERRLDAAGPWALVKLILWTSQNHPDGDLAGMSDEDIELAVDWNKEPGKLVATLAEVGFLDGVEGQRKIHDWAEHNAQLRSAKGRWNACKGHYGEDYADRQVPEWAAVRARHAPSDSSSSSDRSAASVLIH
jgi:hypothetical protein